MNFLRRLPILSELLSHGHDRSTHKKRRAGEFLRSMLIVVPLTILIWIYAENAQKKDDNILTYVGVTVGDAALTPTVLEDADTQINISITGPRGQIELLKNQLETASAGRRLKVPLLPDDAKPGERTINLANTLERDPRFESSGVLITKVVPPQLRVRVDPVATRKVAVALPKNLPVTLLHVNFDPPTVEVRGPRPTLTRLFGPNDQPATNEVDLSNWANVVSGSIGLQTVQIPIRSLDPSLTYSATQIKMSFEVGSTITDWQIPSVQILVQRPLGEEGAYRVEMRRPVVQNVHIRGPANLVDQYRGDSPTAKLTAILNVTRRDVGATDLTKNVEFSSHDPQIQILDEPYPVTFNVVATPSDPNR